jgi:hypothetical protein
MRVVHPRTEARRSQRHMQLVRMLCRRVDPGIEVLDNGGRRALADILRVRGQCGQSVSGLPKLARRFAVSRTIGRQARRETERRLAPLSAFGDGAWHALSTGWELLEHQDRVHEREERARAEALIRAQWPEGGGVLQDRRREEALERMRAAWPEDPRRRLRSWVGWW